jgi:hypothetical protein
MLAGHEREPDDPVLLWVWAGGPRLPSTWRQDCRCQGGIQVGTASFHSYLSWEFLDTKL